MGVLTEGCLTPILFNPIVHMENDMTTLIGICAIVGAACLLGALITGISVLMDKAQGMRPILPPPDRSVTRYAQECDDMARYRAKIERQS